ncbi:hypothetical protein FRC11_004028 [Ceratobasidium sp. 423]|nr:hypothetical protein FRC11_004028 [Ceratobasidium sp. 423]
MSRTPTPTSTTPTTHRATMPPHQTFSAPYYPTTYQYQQPQQAPQQAHAFYDEHESRKRSASAAEQDDEDEPPSAGTSAAPTPREENKSKRTKTQRACDPCRRKKIRCDILPDTDPPICQHCKQYSFNCTFFLPITETRFKKKRVDEEQGAGAGGSTSASRPTATPPTPSLDATHGLPHATHSHSQQPSHAQQQPQSKGEVKIYGPTSLSFLVHSTATIPVRTMESYDTRYHQTWQVGASGEGFIQVLEPSTPNQAASVPLPKPLEHRIERETLQNLINAYFREVSPTFCVITRDEFVRSPAPPPVLLYSMCVAAACSRRVERGVFEALRGTLASVMRNDDVLSVSSVANVQALLILSMNGDCHSVSVPNATSAAWLRAGAAIRMAQDLGMHRAEAVQTDLELRRRLWSACVIVDSWYAASYGHPLTINVLDCDVRLPRADEAEGHKMEFMGELVKLSILLGRVLKSIYSPTGLLHARDSILETLLADLDLWRHQLPQQFVFTNAATTNIHAGLLHLYYACVCMMFWRVFMRISYSCPAHLKFSLTVERMTDMVNMSRDVIDWLSMEEHERIFDCCYMVGYAATAAALIQVRFSVHNVRAPEALRGLEFRKDASRPGGGVFVASKRMIPALSDLPRGTVVPRPDTAEGDRDRESVVSGTSISGGSEESPFGYSVAQQHNVNPALARAELGQSEDIGVQVLNLLDQPLPSESFAVDNEGMLSSIGLPNGLQYDIGANEQWNSLLSQFQPTDQAYHLMQPFSEPYMNAMGTGHLHAPNVNGIGFPPMQPFPQQ